MLAYGLSFGLLAAVASTAYLLFRAYQEVEVLQTPVPKNSLGFQDYTYTARSAEYFPYLVTLPTDVIILICVTIAAFLSARHTRNRSAGFGAALIAFFCSIVLYATASVLVAKYLLEPAIPFGDLSLVGSTVPALAICIAPVLVLTAGCAEWAVSWALPEHRQ
jgi:ABC-type sugar transport system permease subunit